MRSTLLISPFALAVTAAVSASVKKPNVGTTLFRATVPPNTNDTGDPKGLSYYYLPLNKRGREVNSDVAHALRVHAERQWGQGCTARGGVAEFHTNPNWESGFQAVVRCMKDSNTVKGKKVDIAETVADHLKWEKNSPARK